MTVGVEKTSPNFAQGAIRSAWGATTGMGEYGWWSQDHRCKRFASME